MSTMILDEPFATEYEPFHTVYFDLCLGFAFDNYKSAAAFLEIPALKHANTEIWKAEAIIEDITVAAIIAGPLKYPNAVLSFWQTRQWESPEWWCVFPDVISPPDGTVVCREITLQKRVY